MNGQILLGLILGATIGAVAGYLGSLMLTKRMALMGGALGHLTLPGVALALLYDFDVSLGAIVFLAFGVAIIWFLEQKNSFAFGGTDSRGIFRIIGDGFSVFTGKGNEYCIAG
jgi:ABC-type Mn2+/Zn2+ transport system permease subunit